jgi:hypothetical protein
MAILSAVCIVFLIALVGGIAGAFTFNWIASKK